MPPYPTLYVFIPVIISAGMALLLGLMTRVVDYYFNGEMW
jgi:hypothetical protein